VLGDRPHPALASRPAAPCAPIPLPGVVGKVTGQRQSRGPLLPVSGTCGQPCAHHLHLRVREGTRPFKSRVEAARVCRTRSRPKSRSLVHRGWCTPFCSSLYTPPSRQGHLGSPSCPWRTGTSHTTVGWTAPRPRPSLCALVPCSLIASTGGAAPGSLGCLTPTSA
jgi:hypothetical protein